jgi:hypothetical protein
MLKPCRFRTSAFAIASTKGGRSGDGPFRAVRIVEIEMSVFHRPVPESGQTASGPELPGWSRRELAVCKAPHNWAFIASEGISESRHPIRRRSDVSF